MPSTRKRILFVTCWYPTKEEPAFGIFIREHARAVARQPGIDLKVLQIWPVKNRKLYQKEVRAFIDDAGIETHQILIHSRAYKLFYLLKGFLSRCAIRHAEQWLTGWKPDLIHGNVVYQAGVITARMARKWNLPYVISEHWTGLRWYVQTRYVASDEGIRAYQKAQRIFPVSAYLRDNIEQIAGIRLRVKVIPNVVDTGLFLHKPWKAEEAVQIVCVTSFKKTRNQNKLPGLLLDAFSKLPNRERDKLRLKIIGGGEHLNAFEKRIDQLGLSSLVTCLGWQSKEEIARRMQRSDFLVHPTRRETFGVVVAEALCCGVPCIVSNIPALSELVDDSCGILVPENTPEAWGNALTSLSEKRSEYDHEAIADRFREKFNPGTVGKSIVEEYHHIDEIL